MIAETISTKTPFSAQALKNASPYIKWGGGAVGVLGIANTFYQVGHGNISKSRASLDTAMGIIGFMGAPGAIISIVYFGTIGWYEHYTGNQFLSTDEYY